MKGKATSNLKKYPSQTFKPLRLRALRHLRGLKQRQLAQLIWQKQPLISALENGRLRPDIELLHMLAHALGCTPDKFLGDEE